MSNQSSYSYPALERIWANAVRLTRALYPNLQDEVEGLEYLIDDINDELEYFGDMKYIGPYSAIVYKDNSKVYARDTEGDIIAVGESDTDDRRVIQNAIDTLDIGETLVIKKGTYILDGKLLLKPINFIGEGKGDGTGTTLKLADGVNDDIIEMYSGGHLGWKYYYRGGKMAHLRINGNKDAQTAGNGIVLAWTQHYKIEDIYIEYVYDYAIKLIRCMWDHIEDTWMYQCGNGIKIGEYDSDGKYNNGNPGDLNTNMTLLEDAHALNCNYGMHVESGNSNTFISCDTSTCSIGMYICGVTGVQRVWRVNLISHWFEGNNIGIKMTDAGSAEGTRYVVFLACEFGNNTTDRDMGTDGHWIELDKSFLNTGKWDGIATLYKLTVRNVGEGGIYSSGICIPIRDVIRMIPDSPSTGDFGSSVGYLWCQSGPNILTEWDGNNRRYIQALTPISISSDYNAKQGDTIIADASSSSITVTLPDPSNTRRHIIVKKVDSSGNAITINPYNTETIDGSSSYTLTSQYQYVILTTDGSDWYIISD